MLATTITIPNALVTLGTGLGVLIIVSLVCLGLAFLAILWKFRDFEPWR